MNFPNLKEGTVVRALCVIDEGFADAKPGMYGVVVEGPTHSYEYDWVNGKPVGEGRIVDNYGPLVRWLSGGTCNVYDGQVEVVEGFQRIVLTEEERVTFERLVADPPAPTQALVDAMAKHNKKA